jgi:mono/diheme cytochrome c family protein/Flp pilus assembly protein TadD
MAWSGIGVLLLVTLVSGRGVAAWWMRQMASRQIREGRLSEALERLDQVGWLAPEDPQADLLRAACYLHLDWPERWQAALASARQHDAAASQLDAASRLGSIRWEANQQIPENAAGDLLAAGVAPQEVVTAMFFGLLSQGEAARAEALLDAWQADEPEEPQGMFLRGVYAWWNGAEQEAEAAFAKTLEVQPGHEMTQLAMAELLAQQERLNLAAARFAELAGRISGWDRPRLGLAETLRKQGRLDEARRVLEGVQDDGAVAPDTALELAQLDYESGEYSEAVKWFERADLNRPLEADTLRAAASAFAYDGDLNDAQRWFGIVERTHNRYRRLQDLEIRLSLEPNNQAAFVEYQRLAADDGGGSQADVPAEIASGGPSQLYVQYCWACHGTNGDGQGPAARYLFPLARNLRWEKYRLVSTENLVPRLEDVTAVIRDGIPGTSMPAFPQLTENEQRQLAEQVLVFYREGMREHLARLLEEDEDELDEEELDRLVEVRTSPGPVVQPPDLAGTSADAVARGQRLYRELACDKCHGVDGRGDPTVPLYDDNGQPAVPRDLVQDPRKGGPTRESLYLRLRLGMPGTPHPASPVVNPQDLRDLTWYCDSLAQTPKSESTNRERAARASQRALAAEFGHAQDGAASDGS